MIPSSRTDERVLAFAPTGRDGPLTAAILRAADIEVTVCPTGQALCDELGRGAGLLIVAEEGLTPECASLLNSTLKNQPPWSDIPLVVFGGRHEEVEPAREDLETLGNVTVLERPVRMATVVSAVRAGLRARRRQYQIRDLLARLEEADRRKDEFLAMLGHELRNPLAAIQNALAVLEEVGSPEEAAQRQRHLIVRQTRHLNRLVDDLLDVSRVTLGKITLQLRKVDLREVVSDAVQSVRAAASLEHDLRLSLPPQPLPLRADPARIEQVVSNLLSNAIKYTPAGGRIEIGVTVSEGHAELVVQDTGIGIHPAMLSRVFDLFAQDAASSARAQGGLGLGLTLVRALVTMHGGTVEAHSNGPDTGSRFTVRLPLLETATGPTTLPTLFGNGHVAPHGRPHSLRVLVVEDNRDGRESLRELLEVWGHEVRAAPDGPSGLAAVLSERPDVALVDIGLPGLDGYELARQARAELDAEGPCMVAMTGYGQPDDRQRAIEAGFTAHLVKPVDPEILRRILDDCG